MQNAFSEAIDRINTLEDLECLRIHYLGQNGLLKQQFMLLSKISDISEKKILGKTINDLRFFIESNLFEKKDEITQILLLEKISKDTIDVTLPGYNYSLGGLHPVSYVIEKARRIFSTFGFKEVQGPDIEDEWHVFDALNTPKHHPAREMQDSFYLPNGLMLRPHTSSVQIRAMESSYPPFHLISIGKVYRNDWDSTHTPMFHQIEGLCVDEGVSMANLKYYIKEFLENFFERKIEYRLRPSFFPFTEPSMEVDILFGQNNWVEVLGCGMVHNNVLKNIKSSADSFSHLGTSEDSGKEGLKNKTVLTGFAFGMGVERLAMLYNKFSDIRKFYDGNVQWLEDNKNYVY